MLSKSEREFIRDWFKEEGGCSDEFREKWSYDYERVITHRLRNKYIPLLRDLMLLTEILSSYDRNDLFHDYIEQEAEPEEEEIQRLIAFEQHISEAFERYISHCDEENNEKV